MIEPIRQIRAVIVDDDPIVHALLRSQFEAHSIALQCAADGSSGLKLIEQQRPHLCIIDWMLPGMDGLELARAIRSRAETQDTYIIMLTAKSAPDELVAAFDAGVDDFLGKSPNINEFNSRIRAAKRIINLQNRLHSQITQISHLNDQLRLQATTDALTGLPNRRRVLEAMEYLWSQWVRYRTPFCVAMIDIDHFKAINDQHGHRSGDTVLRHVAQVLHNSHRESEIVGRFGGEEFVMGLPQQSLRDASIAMQRLCVELHSNPALISDGSISTTVSVGIASVTDTTPDLEQLIHEADQTMYQAKKTGRNRVCVFGDRPPVSMV